jgi:hypothetical protein
MNPAWGIVLMIFAIIMAGFGNRAGTIRLYEQHWATRVDGDDL